MLLRLEDGTGGIALWRDMFIPRFVVKLSGMGRFGSKAKPSPVESDWVAQKDDRRIVLLMIAIRPAPHANELSNLFLMKVVGIVRISLWQYLGFYA